MARPTPTRSRERARPAAQAAPRKPATGASTRFDAFAPLLMLAGLAVLLVACRGGRLGVAVADDYAFLAWRAFHRPFDWFGTMGAAYYWRPLARQAWFSALSPWLVSAPGVAATLNAALLGALALVLYRIARRALSPWAAAALATTPLLTEAARVWLAWPSAAQHLLAMLGAALAVHEAFAGRGWTAALAGLAGALSHESAALVLPALPLVAWLRERHARAALAMAAPAAIALALWAGGYAFARAHGLPLPPGGLAFERWPAAVAHVATAFAGVEDAAPAPRALMLGAHALLLMAAGLFAFRHDARLRLVAAGPALAAVAALALVAALPLATLLPDWNAWRASLAMLAAGLAVGGLLAAAEPWLLAAFVALRAVALLMAPLPLPIIAPTPPASASDLSFTRLTRLQIAAVELRSELRLRHPTLPPGARIYTWSFPTMIEVGLQSQLAARVWYGDSTLTWRRFGGIATYDSLPDVVLGMNPNFPDRPVVVIERRSSELTRQAVHAFDAEQYALADSLFMAAQAAQPRPLWETEATAILNRAICRFQLGDFAPAESLAAVARELAPGNGDAPAVLAWVALVHGQRDAAAGLLREAFAKSPNSEIARQAAEAYDRSGALAR